MKLETRERTQANHITKLLDVVLIPNKRESKIIDSVFGNKVGDDGLIFSGDCRVEVRLSDGYDKHYIIIHSIEKNVRAWV